MNRLDQHIGMVRSKLAAEQFLIGLGYAVVAFFSLVLVAVLVDRFLWVSLPRGVIWFWTGVGVSVLAAAGFGFVRRPSPHRAAVFIDEKLGLNEKFSTALFARSAADHGTTDPFVIAAVLDAERTADNVSLHRRFPISFPASGYMALGAGVLVLVTAWLLPRFDLFDRQEKLAAAHRTVLARQEAQAQAQAVLTKIQSMPASTQSRQQIELAKKEIQHALDQPLADPAVVKLTAQKAEEEAETAKQEEIKNNQAFAQAQTDKAVFNSLNPSLDDKGPVADASKAIANADFSKAIDALQGMQQKFNEMTPQEQAKSTEQMKSVAQQLQKIASDPAAMKNLQQQLQQQGVSPQQMQQVAKAVQQAAQGNPQAQQQLQKLQQQLTQQMNGGKGPTQQQQQAIQKAMQQMQQVASSQSKAMQMTSAAQQMVQGMQAAQAAHQGGTKAGQAQANAQTSGQQGGPKQGGQQQSGQQGGQQQASGGQKAGQQGGQQAGGQQAGQQPGGQQQGGQQQASAQQGSQPGGQSGGQKGQGPGQGGQQQMQQATQQMAQALGEMDAVQKDAEQQEVSKNSGDQNDPNNQGDGQSGDQAGGQPNGPGGQGPGQMGHPGNKKGNGMGGPGIGQGGVGQKQLAQFSVKQELDPSQNIAGGKVLAKAFVKADQVIGKSTIQLSAAARAAVKESTDDVSEETVPKDAQKAVKDYFDTVGN